MRGAIERVREVSVQNVAQSKSRKGDAGTFPCICACRYSLMEVSVGDPIRLSEVVAMFDGVRGEGIARLSEVTMRTEVGAAKFRAPARSFRGCGGGGT